MEDCALYSSSHAMSATLYDAAVPEQLVLDSFFLCGVDECYQWEECQIFQALAAAWIFPRLLRIPMSTQRTAKQARAPGAYGCCANLLSVKPSARTRGSTDPLAKYPTFVLGGPVSDSKPRPLSRGRNPRLGTPPCLTQRLPCKAPRAKTLYSEPILQAHGTENSYRHA